MNCPHDRVNRTESLNPRMRLVRWTCAECGQDFEIMRSRFIEWATLKLEARRLRHDLEVGI